MRPAEKLLLIAGISRGMYSRWRLQRIMTALVMLAMLTVAIAVTINVLLIGCVYAAYLLLISHGVDPLVTIYVIGLLVLFFTLMLLLIVRWRIRKLKSSVSTPAGEIVDAFFDGLFSK